MDDKKQHPFIKIVKWAASIIGFLSVFGFMITASIEWGQFKQNQTEITFPDSEAKHKTMNHVNEVPNVVENFKAMQQNIEIAKKLDTALIWHQSMSQKYIDKIEQDSINDADAIRSRAKRDSLREMDVKDLEQIKKDLQRTENAIQLILSNQQKILDTIN